MHKKADMALSINAIVILILAITMLGLGLAFMRNIFGRATGEFNEVSGEVQKQMISQMKATNKIVDLSGAVYEIKPGEKKMAYISFKNDGNEAKNFTIFKIVPSSLSGQSTCGVGAEDVILEYKQTPTKVQPGATTVIPINIKAGSKAAKDSCFFEIQVSTDSNNLACTGNYVNETPISCISSSYSSLPPTSPCSNAYDSSTTTSWVAQTYSVDPSPSVRFDLGSKKCISSVSVNLFSAPPFPKNISVALSNEGSSWNKVINLWTLRDNALNTSMFSEATGRYINVTIIQLSDIIGNRGIRDFKAQTRNLSLAYDQSIQLTVNVAQ